MFGAALLLNCVVASQGFFFPKKEKKSFSLSPWMKVANKIFLFSRPERPVQISLYGFAVALYHLLKFRFKSLLAEEYKSLLSIPPPLLEVTVSRCMYYCLIGD